MMFRPSAMTTYASATVASSMKPPPPSMKNGSSPAARITAPVSASFTSRGSSGIPRRRSDGPAAVAALTRSSRLSRLFAEQAGRFEDHDQHEVGEHDRRGPLGADAVVGYLLDAADDDP